METSRFKSQYLAVLDRNAIQLIHPVKSFIGTSFYGNYTQQATGHNLILNNIIIQYYQESHIQVNL